mmetsp:Transcript_74106/g.195328  ORF Transcript_74106/g.195328 Transcript_74106/m.195328 type:complete len:226 (+) Transcript_74106:324-1001(+)
MTMTSCKKDGALALCGATVFKLGSAAGAARWSRARLLTSVSKPDTLPFKISKAPARAVSSSLRNDELTALAGALEILKGKVSGLDTEVNRRALLQRAAPAAEPSLKTVAPHNASAPSFLQEVIVMQGSGSGSGSGHCDERAAHRRAARRRAVRRRRAVHAVHDVRDVRQSGSIQSGGGIWMQRRISGQVCERHVHPKSPARHRRSGHGDESPLWEIRRIKRKNMP